MVGFGVVLFVIEGILKFLQSFLQAFVTHNQWKYIYTSGRLDWIVVYLKKHQESYFVYELGHLHTVGENFHL